MLGFDPLYFAIVAPAFILSLLATVLTRSRFARYANVPSGRGLSGAEAARWILDRAGLSHVQVVEHQGLLTDHYDPRERVLRLSPAVYEGRSVSSIAVAAHESGHALQHADGYWPLGARTALVPVATFGSNFAYVIIFFGFILHLLPLAYAGVLLFTAVVAFQLVTLPVEFNASSRAKGVLVRNNLVTADERRDVSKVLDAAALTYVAAAASAALTLLYFLLRTGLLGGGSRERR